MVDEAIKVESYLSQGGKIKAKLTAPLLLRVQEDTLYTEFPKSLHVDFYSDKGTIETRLDSHYGKYFETLNKIYLKDSVQVISTKGDTLLCEDLWWDQNKQLFYTNRRVVQKSPAIPYYVGEDGLEATQDLKRTTFKNTRGKLKTTESDTL